MNPRELLRKMFFATIEAAQPEHCVPPYLPAPPAGRLIVIGAGKASFAPSMIKLGQFIDRFANVLRTP